MPVIKSERYAGRSLMIGSLGEVAFDEDGCVDVDEEAAEVLLGVGPAFQKIDTAAGQPAPVATLDEEAIAKALGIESALVAKAESLGLDPQFYAMTEDELKRYAMDVFGEKLDKRRSFEKNVQRVMELQAALDEAGYDQDIEDAGIATEVEADTENPDSEEGIEFEDGADPLTDVDETIADK